MIIWLASYPRSGNTFFRVLLHSVFGVKTHSIYNDKVDIASDPATSEAVGHELLPDDFDIDALRKGPKLYLIKTHGEPDVVRPEDKVIYLIRDGRESSLSYCKYINTYNDPNTTLNDVIDGNVPFGSWGRHVDMWQQSTKSETMFIRFETLVDTPQEYLPEISSFIGLPPLNNSIPTFEELQVINPKFFHKGMKDSWKDEYQPQEHLRFWIQNDSEMTEYGYKTHKPELFSDAALAERALPFTPDKKIITVTEIRQLQKSKNQSNALKGKLENTRDQVNDLRGKLENTRGQRDATQKSLTHKTATAVVLRGKLESTRGQVNDLRGKLENTRGQVNDLRGKLENTRGQRDATQERLTKKIAVVEGLLKNNQEITQRLNSFSHELSAKNRRITEIEKDYDLLKSPLKNLTSTSLLRNPVRKYRQYKQVLNAYQNGKIRSANRDLRKSQQTKKLKMVKAPLFSIITVTYNAEAFLNTTLKNILSQTFKDFELIIIDGNSSDQTLSIIRKYNSRIDYWVSEQDTGIYDAMNKGIAQASGDWINFMNAGDIFSSETTLEEVSKSIPKEADIIYGDRHYVKGRERTLQKAKSINSIFERMPFGHQSTFIKNSVLSKNKFNQTYKYAADYNLFLTLYTKNYQFHYVDLSICDFIAGGQSESGLGPYIESIKIILDNARSKEEISKNQYLATFRKISHDLIDQATK